MNLTLKPNSLTNVDDAAEIWLFEGGEVSQEGKLVAHYASTKHVLLNGAEAQNTAMLTITLFFLGQRPPENIRHYREVI
jgi:hypothetical protein